jgi:hypothetical protein
MLPSPCADQQTLAVPTWFELLSGVAACLNCAGGSKKKAPVGGPGRARGKRKGPEREIWVSVHRIAGTAVG